MRYVIEGGEGVDFVAYRAIPLFEKAGNGHTPMEALHALMRLIAEAEQPYPEPPVNLLDKKEPINA
jgi:hypothetical protein